MATCVQSQGRPCRSSFRDFMRLPCHDLFESRPLRWDITSPAGCPPRSCFAWARHRSPCERTRTQRGLRRPAAATATATRCRSASWCGGNFSTVSEEFREDIPCLEDGNFGWLPKCVDLWYILVSCICFKNFKG